MSIVRVGQKAPDFEAPAYQDGREPGFIRNFPTVNIALKLSRSRFPHQSEYVVLVYHNTHIVKDSL